MKQIKGKDVEIWLNMWQSNQSRERLLPDELSPDFNHISAQRVFLPMHPCYFSPLCQGSLLFPGQDHNSAQIVFRDQDAALFASAISCWKSHWWGVNLSSPFSLGRQLSSWDRVKSCPRPKDASVGEVHISGVVQKERGPVRGCGDNHTCPLLHFHLHPCTCSTYPYYCGNSLTQR